MPDLTHVDLNVSQSGLPSATDAWYTWLRGQLNVTAPQKIALLGTIAGYEIIPNAPMFNQFIYRSWVDRSLIGSPTSSGSPSFFARYSNAYKELLTRSTAQIDASIPADTAAAIDTIREDITGLQTQMENERDRVRKAWSIEAAAEGLNDPKTPAYVIARVGFVSAELNYSKMQSYKKQIARKLASIDRLLNAALLPDERVLMQLYDFSTLQEYQLKRPKTADIEEKYQLDVVSLADFDKYDIPSVFEDGEDILPSKKLEAFLKTENRRDCVIDRNSDHSYAHESDWHASAGGGFPFLSANVDTSGSSRYSEAVKRIGKLSIGFKNIDEIFAIRGPWFSSAALTNPASLAEMKKDPKGLAATLTNLIQSAIVVRGLSLTLYFENQDDFDSFSQWSASASGSSIFGIPLGGGGGGGGSTVEKGRDRATSSITYGDADDQCRIVGFRIDQLLSDVQPSALFEPWMDPLLDDKLEEIRQNRAIIASRLF